MFIKKFYKSCELKTNSRPWKMKLLKQPAYIRYVTAKLSKFVEIVMHTSLDSFLHGILRKRKRGWNWFPDNIFSRDFLIKKFLLGIYISSLRDSFFFPSYSVKCVSCFIFKHLMTSWHLNI